MFMLSFRLSKRKILLGSLALVLVVSVGIASAYRLAQEEIPTATTATVESAKPTVKPKKVTVKSNEQRVAFLKSFGWEVGEDPVEIMEVIIPKEFDEVYTTYNATQKQQGYDLEAFAGKRVKRYSYIVTNYPGVQDEVRINLLVFKDKVIGGDVCSLTPTGFLHGFTA